MDGHEAILDMSFNEQTDVAAKFGIHTDYVLSENATFPATGLQKTAENVYRCGLAGSVLAQKSKYATLWHGKAKVFVYAPFAVVMG